MIPMHPSRVRHGCDGEVRFAIPVAGGGEARLVESSALRVCIHLEYECVFLRGERHRFAVGDVALAILDEGPPTVGGVGRKACHLPLKAPASGARRRVIRVFHFVIRNGRVASGAFNPAEAHRLEARCSGAGAAEAEGGGGGGGGGVGVVCSGEFGQAEHADDVAVGVLRIIAWQGVQFRHRSCGDEGADVVGSVAVELVGIAGDGVGVGVGISAVGVAVEGLRAAAHFVRHVAEGGYGVVLGAPQEAIARDGAVVGAGSADGGRQGHGQVGVGVAGNGS